MHEYSEKFMQMLPIWLQKLANRELYQSQKLTNKKTLSRI